MKEILVPFVKRHKAPHEADYVLDALSQPFIDDNGKYRQMCQDILKEEYSCAQAILTQTGFVAIYLAFLALKVKTGDEIIISSYSCPSVLNCLLLLGATPVLCGVNDTGIMAMDNIKKAFSYKTKAVVVNHHGGYESDILVLAKFCKDNNISLIEDCATAFGSSLNNKKLGTFGDFAILSFNDKKDLCGGEGGALIVNNSDYIESLRYLEKNGIIRNNNIPLWVGMGFSNKVSDVVSSVIYAQLEDAYSVVNTKKNICSFYIKNLKKYADQGVFRLPHTESGFSHNGNTFFLLFNEPVIKKNLKAYLRENGIISLSHYGTLETGSYHAICCEGTYGGLWFDERMLRLPIYTSMSMDELIYVNNKLSCFLDKIV